MSYQSHYFKEVREAQKNAYAPYSNFKVGAYLRTKVVGVFTEQMLRTLHTRWGYVQKDQV
ncbi:cytidine deaminase [Staphylococcus epidermidis]